MEVTLVTHPTLPRQEVALDLHQIIGGSGVGASQKAPGRMIEGISKKRQFVYDGMLLTL